MTANAVLTLRVVPESARVGLCHPESVIGDLIASLLSPFFEDAIQKRLGVRRAKILGWSTLVLIVIGTALLVVFVPS